MENNSYEYINKIFDNIRQEGTSEFYTEDPSAYEKTPPLAGLSKLCPPQFSKRIDPEKLANPQAFDAVINWEGSFPGPLCAGKTGTAKTRAAWAAIARLAATEDYRCYATRPDGIIGKIKNGWSLYNLTNHIKNRFDIIFIDSLEVFDIRDKEAVRIIMGFYDYIYSERHPCITTMESPLTFLRWEETEHPIYSDEWLTRRIRESHHLIEF